MSSLVWRIVCSKSFLRAFILFNVAIVTGNVLFSVYYFLWSTATSGTLTEVNQVIINNDNAAQYLSKNNPVAPKVVSEQSKFIHKLYWELVKKNKSNIVKTAWLNEADRGRLRAILEEGALWGAMRNKATGKVEHGVDPKYDHHLILQQIWQQSAFDTYPELFHINETIRIVIRDDFSWWGYAGGANLSCPNHFSHKCTLTEGHDLSEADAVIAVRDGFHSKDFFVSRDMFRIYFIQESPYASPETRLLRRNDLLASYWRGSELPARYANWVHYDPTVRSKAAYRDYTEGKTRLAAIFTSNCLTFNRRLEAVEELQKYIPVDVYGACGNRQFVCERYDEDNCFKKLKTDYFFYLAFENSNCRDYVTEKFFVNALKNDVVPVVLGAHRNDYVSLAPEGSFIMAEDFESAEELAKYLEYLSKTPEAYNAYFKWKDTGEFIGSDFFCRVCSLLWFAKIHPPPRRRSVFFWAPEDNTKHPMCLSRGKKMWRMKRGNETWLN